MEETLNLKRELRQRTRDFYDGLSTESYKELSQLISKEFLKILIHWPPGGWGVFEPMQDEPNWKEFLSSTNKNFSDFEHKFYPCQWEIKDDFMTFVDSESGEEVTPDYLLVPGLGFAKTGARLGRGKGFYDRYLENFEGKSVGICFENQIYPEIPEEVHDQKVNFLLTEDAFYDCN